MSPILKEGDFVQVRADSSFRPGQDGMVVEADDGKTVGLMFGCDRHGRGPFELGITFSALTEAWDLTELDLGSVSH